MRREFGGPHSLACLSAPYREFRGDCPAGPRQPHGWGLGGVALAIRERCIASPLYLASEVLSTVWPANLFNRPSEAHRVVEQAMVEQRDLLYVDARGTGKTTLVDECGSVWQLLKFVNDTIILFQHTEPQARALSSQVREHFISNDAMRAIFPEYHIASAEAAGDVRSWNVPCRTVLTKEGSFDIGTPGSSRTGNHYVLGLASDLMNPETTPPPCGRSTLETMKSVIAWYAQMDGLLQKESVNPRAHRRLDLNRWHDGDLAGELIRKDVEGTIQKVIRGVRRGDDGRFVSTWPEVISSEELHRIHARPSMNAATWAANFESDPKPEGGISFLPEWLHNYPSPCVAPGCGRRHETPAHLDLAICVDPAFTDDKSVKAKTDRSAIVVWGTGPDGHLYVPQTYAGRWGPNEFVETLFTAISFAKYLHGLRWVGIEDTGGSRALVSIFLDEQARSGRRVIYRKLKHAGKSKDARMAPLHNHAEHYGLYIHDGNEALKQELLRWEVTEHRDLADALSYAALELIMVPQERRPEEPPVELTVLEGGRRETGAELQKRRAARRARQNAPVWKRGVG